MRKLIKTVSVLWNDNSENIQEEISEGVIGKKIFDVLYFYLDSSGTVDQYINNFYDRFEQISSLYEFVEHFDGGQDFYDRAVTLIEDIKTTKDVIDKVNKLRKLSKESLGYRKQEFFNTIDKLIKDVAEAYPNYLVYTPDSELSNEEEKTINSFKCSIQLPGIKKLLNEIGTLSWEWIVTDGFKKTFKLTYNKDVSIIYIIAKNIDTTTFNKVIDETQVKQLELIISDINETEGIEEENEGKYYEHNTLAKNKSFFVYRLKKWIFNLTGEEIKIAEPSKSDTTVISSADDRGYNVESTLIHHRLNTVYRADKHSVADINTIKGGLHTIAFEDDLYILDTSEKFLSQYRLRLGMEVYCLDTGRKFRLIGGDMVCNKAECKCTLIQGKCNEEARGCTGMVIRNPKWIQVMEFKYLEETLNNKVRTTYDIDESDDPRIVISMEYLKKKIFNHTHEGTTSKKISFYDLIDTNKIDCYMLGGHRYDYFAPKKHTHSDLALANHEHPEFYKELNRVQKYIAETYLEKNRVKFVELENDNLKIKNITTLVGSSSFAARSDHYHEGYYLETDGKKVETSLKNAKDILDAHMKNSSIHTPYDDTVIQNRVTAFTNILTEVSTTLTNHRNDNSIHKAWSEIKAYVDAVKGEIIALINGIDIDIDTSIFLKQADKTELLSLIGDKLNIPSKISPKNNVLVSYNMYGLITGGRTITKADIPVLDKTFVPDIDNRLTILEGQTGHLNTAQVDVYIAPDARYYINNGYGSGTDSKGRTYYYKSGKTNRYGGNKFYPGDNTNLEKQYEYYGNTSGDTDARNYPLFTLNQAMQFLRRFRANGSITYKIWCEAGEYYFDTTTQIISHPDCTVNTVLIEGVRNEGYQSISDKKSYLNTLGENNLDSVYKTIFKITPTSVEKNSDFYFARSLVNFNETNTKVIFRYCWFATNYHKFNSSSNSYNGALVSSCKDTCFVTFNQSINVTFSSCGFYGCYLYGGTNSETNVTFHHQYFNTDSNSYAIGSSLSMDTLQDYCYPSIFITNPIFSTSRIFFAFNKGVVTLNNGYYFAKINNCLIQAAGNGSILSLATSWNGWLKLDYVRISTSGNKQIFIFGEQTSGISSGNSIPTISNPKVDNNNIVGRIRINYYHDDAGGSKFITKFNQVINPYLKGFDASKNIKNTFILFNSKEITKATIFYNDEVINDDTDPIPSNDNGSSNILNLIYPVGSIYISTAGSKTSGCPLASVISGSTWEFIEGRYLLSSGKLAGGAASETYSTKANVEGGLPNISGECGSKSTTDDEPFTNCDGAYSKGALDLITKTSKGGTNTGAGAGYCRITLDASKSNNIYGKSATVRPPAYVVNVWRRTS